VRERLFKFINGVGKPVWILPESVLCMYVDVDGLYVIQCLRTLWTMNKEDFYRLLEVVNKLGQSHDQEGDWWKNGKPNPLDNEEDEDDE